MKPLKGCNRRGLDSKSHPVGVVTAGAGVRAKGDRLNPW